MVRDSIDPDDLIVEVEKRPGLYQKDHPCRLEPYYRERLWLEVASNVFPDWDSLEDSEKKEKATDVQKRWRNIRDAFMKEIQIQSKIEAGFELKKKKRYCYYDKLMFLVPGMEHTNPVNTTNPIKRLQAPSLSSTKMVERVERKHKKPVVLKKIKKPTKKRKQHHNIDEDKTFLLSLVPSFRKMHEEQKLLAKVEILNAIRRVKSQTINLPESHSSYEYITPSTSDPIKMEYSEESEESSDESIDEKPDIDSDSE